MGDGNYLKSNVKSTLEDKFERGPVSLDFENYYYYCTTTTSVTTTTTSTAASQLVDHVRCDKLYQKRGK